MEGEITDKERLFEAAEKNDLETVRFYIEGTCIPFAIMNKDRQNIAHVAAKNGHLDIVKFMAEKHPSVLEEEDSTRQKPFLLAVQKGAFDIVKYLAENHPNSTKPDFWNIQTAIEYDHIDILKYFFEQKNFDVNIKNKLGECPLYLAIEYERPHMIKYLLDERNDADLTVLTDNNENLLYITVVANNLPMMKRLWDEKKVPYDVNWQNRYNDTLLHLASIMNCSEIVQYLVDEKHADLNIIGTEGMTPLHCAACRDNAYICKFLCERGANTSILDEEEQYPWEKAFDEDLIKYLNSSAKRNRRSVPLPYFYKPNPAVHSGLLSVDHLNSNRIEKSFDGVYTFSNLLLLAQYVLKKMTGFRMADARPLLLPHLSILQGKIDPVAIDAVYAAIDFEE